MKTKNLSFKKESKGVFVIKSLSNVKGQIVVNSTDGRLIKQYKLNGLNETQQIDLEDQPTGVYIITLMTAEQRKSNIKIYKD